MGLWSVYVDKDGGERTQTLDKHLKLDTLSKKPRLKIVLNTADYVLAACTLSAKRQERLDTMARQLRDSSYNAPFLPNNGIR